MTKDECKQVVLDIIADIAPDEDLSNVKPDVRLRDQLDLEIPVTWSGELGLLAASFNDMTRSLRRIEGERMRSGFFAACAAARIASSSSGVR